MISRTRRQVGLPSSPRPSRPTTPNIPPSEPPSSSVSSRPQYTAPVPSDKRSQPLRRPVENHEPTMNTDDNHAGTKYNQRLRQIRPEYSQPPQTGDVSLQSESFNSTLPENTDKAAVGEANDNGYAIWTAVTKAASALTVSVGNTWISSLTNVSGEETPPGQESRLTRAMKAYHIAKAQDTSDLPDWLFNEKDRLVVQTHSQSEELDENQFQKSTLPHKVPSATRELSGPERLRGAGRLKELRDAKRRARAPVPSEKGFGSNNDVHQPYLENGPIQAAVIQPRIGLPSGPQRGRR